MLFPVRVPLMHLSILREMETALGKVTRTRSRRSSIFSLVGVTAPGEGYSPATVCPPRPRPAVSPALLHLTEGPVVSLLGSIPDFLGSGPRLGGVYFLSLWSVSFCSSLRQAARDVKCPGFRRSEMVCGLHAGLDTSLLGCGMVALPAENRLSLAFPRPAVLGLMSFASLSRALTVTAAPTLLFRTWLFPGTLVSEAGTERPHTVPLSVERLVSTQSLTRGLGPSSG